MSLSATFLFFSSICKSQVKFLQIEYRMVTASQWEEWMESCLMNTEFSFAGWRVLEISCVMMQMYLTMLNCTLKKWLHSLILCHVYIIIKNKNTPSCWYLATILVPICPILWNHFYYFIYLKFTYAYIPKYKQTKQSRLCFVSRYFHQTSILNFFTSNIENFII